MASFATARTLEERLLRKGQQEGEFFGCDVRVMAGAIRAAIDALPPCFIANPHLDVDRDAREVTTLCDRATRKQCVLTIPGPSITVGNRPPPSHDLVR